MSRFQLALSVPRVVDADIVVTPIEELYMNKKLGQFWVTGKILGVESYVDWFYISCKGNSCNKKVVEQENGLMQCPKCLRSWQDGIVKYKVVVCVADQSGDAPMLIWDWECSNLVGMSAGELKVKYLGEVDCVPVELQQLNGLAMLFRVVVKKEQLDSFQSPFIVLSICKDEEMLTQHCSTLITDSPLTILSQGLGPQVDEGPDDEDFFGFDPDDCVGLKGLGDEEVQLSDVAPVKRCFLADFSSEENVVKKSKAIVVKEEK